jgi:hypothetical protein
MKSGATPVLGWAAFLTFLTAVLFAWTPDAELQWGPFALAALATWAIGVVVLFRRRGRTPHLSPRSGAGVLLGIALAVAGNALVFGWWLAPIGAVLLVASLALFVREAR